MGSEYYALISSYQTQDSQVLFSIGIALFVLAAWALIRWLNNRLAEYLFWGQLIAVYILMLVVLGFALP
jgi:hypothetical protein